MDSIIDILTRLNINYHEHADENGRTFGHAHLDAFGPVHWHIYTDSGANGHPNADRGDGDR